jgi:hypothetical protein
MTSWLLLNGGAVVAALALARARGATTRMTSPALAALSGYLALVHSLVLSAGLGGHLTVAGLGLLLAGAVVASLWLARGVPPSADGTVERPVGILTWFAGLAAIVAAGIWVWPQLTQATRLWIWDDYTYHMIYPTLWLRDHVIAAASPVQAFTMQAWYPLSASVVATWFMAPWAGARGEALAGVSLTGVLYGGIVATAVAALLARAGCRPAAWALPLVLFATSPRIAVMASSFSDADLAQAAALLGGLAFAMPRGAADHRGDAGVRSAESLHDLGADAGYAGLLTGFALGVKVSAAPVALVVLGLLGWRARALPPPARGRGTIAVVLLLVAAWLTVAGYWYARNVLHTGNPLYPAAWLGWPGTTFPETTLLEYWRHYGVRRTFADALPIYADWPRSHAILAGLGLIGLATWLLARGRGATRAQRAFAGGTLVTAIIILVLLPLAPYSAGNSMTFRSGFVHWDSMRYVALVPILGWVALGFLVDAAGPVRGGAAAAVLTAAVLLTSTNASLASPLVVTGLALGTVLIGWLRPARLMTGRRPVVAAAAGAVVIGGIVLGWHGTKAAATAASIHREPLYGRVVAVLDGQPAGTRVAVFGDQWIYPTFGDRAHLDPIRLDRDGHPAAELPGDAMEPGDLTVDPAMFASNLRASGVDVVVVLRLPHPGRSGERPSQEAALESLGIARLLHRDGAATVWRLTP